MKDVIVFVDGNNLFHRMWHYYKTHLLNIEDLAQKLCNINRNLKQIRYYYSPFIKEVDFRTTKLQQKYIETIRKNEKVIITEGKYIKKPILLKKETFNKIKEHVKKEELKTYVEKGIDVKMTIDIVSMIEEYDWAILVTTDSDFVPVINYINNIPKKKIQVASFLDKEHSCFDLKNASKSFINLHHFIPAILRDE